MPIAQADLKLYKAQTHSDTSSNGGRMSTQEITSGAVANLFPAIGEAERTAGSTKYRKAFIKNANDDDLAHQFPKVVLDLYTLGDDIITFFPGTQTNIQSAITGSEKQYGCGKLDVNASATDTEIDVEVEDGTDHTFEDGDLIRITNKSNVNESGEEEFVTIVGTPSVAGDVITITFTPALANNYSASNSRVMNVYKYRDAAISVSGITRSGSTATATTAAPHKYETGDTILIAGANQAEYNGEHEIAVTGASTFTYTVTGSPATPATGTITAAKNLDIVARIGEVVVTSAAGTFDAGDLLADNIATIQQSITFTFTNGTTFTIASDVLGSLGSGSIGAGAAPNNADFGKPFFTALASAFGGTFLAGDTITFPTVPSAVPIWFKRVVPAGAAAAAPNTSRIAVLGETA